MRKLAALVSILIFSSSSFAASAVLAAKSLSDRLSIALTNKSAVTANVSAKGDLTIVYGGQDISRVHLPSNQSAYSYNSNEVG